MRLQSNYYLFFLLFSAFLIQACVAKPKGTFEDQKISDIPDYSKEENWAALPWRVDNADKVPPGFQNEQDDAKVDVFFLHPTNYFGDREYTNWNAPIDLKSINENVDNVSILFQASAFNKAGKVYAPRYRQAHIQAYFMDDKVSAKKAFDLAYGDVKEAFAYYLSHYNNNRPFIIASHSQGTTHAQRLIKEFIDNKPLQKRLVAAYLIGIPVDMDQYVSLKACDDENDTNCLISWRTWNEGTKPKYLEEEKDKNILITNPLSWKITNEKVSKEKNLGGVIDMKKEPIKNIVGAQIYESILWAEKPKFRGSWLLTTKNYHQGDINLYYVNIRENAAHRADVFLKNK